MIMNKVRDVNIKLVMPIVVLTFLLLGHTNVVKGEDDAEVRTVNLNEIFNSQSNEERNTVNHIDRKRGDEGFRVYPQSVRSLKRNIEKIENATAMSVLARNVERKLERFYGNDESKVRASHAREEIMNKSAEERSSLLTKTSNKDKDKDRFDKKKNGQKQSAKGNAPELEKKKQKGNKGSNVKGQDKKP
ncbi:hypothetical protein [Evansella halocellulosilytica]|uniref:hypothetical protein n=1 Tax=Evansella halocellulosilytica TaxID=2011013 RepID=UPI000BB775DC|nr:hypothetical protein [Evansella halocellulosilytica]